MAKPETVDAAGNATSSAALPSAALAVHEGREHASVNAIRRNLHRKGDGLVEFLVGRVVVWNFIFLSRWNC